jgi:hypothetical protein
MVFTCIVWKGFNCQREGLSFLCIPKDVRKIRAWVKAVNRDGWIPNN